MAKQAHQKPDYDVPEFGLHSCHSLCKAGERGREVDSITFHEICL